MWRLSLKKKKTTKKKHKMYKIDHVVYHFMLFCGNCFNDKVYLKSFFLMAFSQLYWFAFNPFIRQKILKQILQLEDEQFLIWFYSRQT